MAIATSTPETSVILRIRSHQARRTLIRILGYLPQGYYSWDHPGAEWREVTAEEAGNLPRIKGVTVARVDRAVLRKYFLD